jgi:hypothetical protein
MPQQDSTGIIMIAAVGGIAFYGYEQGWFSGLFGTAVAPAATVPSAPAAVVTTSPVVSAPVTATPAAPITTPPAPSISGMTPAQAQAAMQLAQANTTGQNTLNADQWQFYWNQIGFPAIDPTVYGSTFFPNGRPASTSDYTQYSALQFVIAAEAQENQALAMINAIPHPLVGFGNYHGISASAIHGGW